MANVVNLTPHTVKVVLGDGSEIELPSAGKARVVEQVEPAGQVDGIPLVHKRVYLASTDLPPERPGTLYVVPYYTRACHPERGDLLVPHDLVRRSGAMLPAGQVTPSPKPFDAGGQPLRLVDEAAWTSDMRAVVEFAQRIAVPLLGVSIAVQIANDPQWTFAATFGDRRLTLNLGRLGHKWFAGPAERITALTLHELAHHTTVDHLSSEYHDHEARFTLGAHLALLAAADPAVSHCGRQHRPRRVMGSGHAHH